MTIFCGCKLWSKHTLLSLFLIPLGLFVFYISISIPFIYAPWLSLTEQQAFFSWPGIRLVCDSELMQHLPQIYPIPFQTILAHFCQIQIFFNYNNFILTFFLFRLRIFQFLAFCSFIQLFSFIYIYSLFFTFIAFIRSVLNLFIYFFADFYNVFLSDMQILLQIKSL